MKTIANTDKLIKIWDSQKNIDLDPKKISIYNKKNKFWWICQYNHSFQSTAITRFNSKNCPVCVNQKVIKGLNDLKTTNPELAKEWNYNKNLEIDINQITKGSNKGMLKLSKEFRDVVPVANLEAQFDNLMNSGNFYFK
jgi:hypothetical protein